jgi:hypothetical protein
VGEDVAAVGDLQRQVHVLLDEQHGGARRIGRGADHGQQPLDDDRRQAEAELVEQQQLGAAQESTGDGQHLLLASGQQAGPAASQVAQGGKVLEGGLVIVGVPVETKVLGHREPEEDAAVLGHVHDPGAHSSRR